MSKRCGFPAHKIDANLFLYIIKHSINHILGGKMGVIVNESGIFVTDWTGRKFQPGQAVRCVAPDNDFPGCAPLLEAGKIYHVVECNTAEECEFLFPRAGYWRENGGRVILQEMPELEFFARRFEPVNTRMETTAF